MTKRNDFTNKVKKIIRTAHTPNSLEDFLNDTTSSDVKGNNVFDKHDNINEGINYKREEFKFPIGLSERLRLAAFKLKKTKREVIQEALENYLKKINF